MRKKIRYPKKFLFFRSIRINIFWITVFLIVFAIFFSLSYIGKKILPGATSYAEVEIKKFSTRVINSVISTELSNMDVESLFIITKDKEDYIKTIDYNPIAVNQILANVTSSLERIFRNVEKGENLFELSDEILENYDIEKLKKGIIFELVPGVVFNNPLLINIGPTIPVKISLLGSIESHLTTRVTNYGINNALVEMIIKITISARIVLPYRTKDVVVESEIPISTKLIQGSIPNYYFNGFDKNSTTYTIPLE